MPQAYASRPGSVGVTETHMSWVFLAGDRVYKLKKPLYHPFLDFRTLAAREVNCREEVRLNRRLAPQVYLGVVPLTLEPDGRLKLGGRGEIVDWLVEMRRLPAELMLDHAIADHTLARDGDTRRIDAVADLLIAFYRASPPADITPAAYVQRFEDEQEINEAVLRDPRFGLDATRVDYVLEAVRRHLEEDTAMLEARVTQGRVIEGHGDLRPEHFCLSDPPVIIDCLEFSRNLRLVDPFDELTFLALECERLGVRWIGERLMQRCAEGLDDSPPQALLHFYWGYRACLRARLSLVHLLDPHPREPSKWFPLANRYMDLAQSEAVMPVLRAVP